MCITEQKLVDAYANGNPHERFSLIYKNYEVFLQLVDSFETGLLNQILFEVEYNRRAKNYDDLGVRIQNLRFSDPTASKAIEHIMIREAVEECNFSGNILKETDNPEKHKRDILTIHMMRREFEVFDSCLKTLPEEGKPCSEAYKRVYESNRRLCERLGVDEDPDVESIINYMFDITRTVAEKMFAYGAALGEN